MVHSQSLMMGDINAKIAELDSLITGKQDPDWETLAISMISHLQDPIHNMILSWNDWWMSQNGMAANTDKWDPANVP